MNALRQIRAALVPGGLIVDTQPISPRPPVELPDGSVAGRLDMHVWRSTIDAVDRRTARALDDGLFAIELERHVVVTDTYDNGPELVEEVHGWKGTRISRSLATRLAGVTGPVSLHQDVRLRVLRATEPRRECLRAVRR